MIKKSMVTSSTRLLGIFGDPISHTLSPVLHNAALKELGLDYVYLPFHVTPNALKGAVESIRSLGMRGVNITIPHKESVMEYLDEVSDEAKGIGAVNTIVNSNGRLIGHNTDGRGYIRSLSLETGLKLSGKRLIIFGAGGATRAILSAVLAHEPASVLVANRTQDRADRLVADFSVGSNTELKTSPLEKPALLPFIEEADLLINTTSLGMRGKVQFNPLLLSLDKLPKEAIVSDIVYKPLDTALLKSARRSGHKVHKGLGMLIQQGALGFDLWTGEQAPINTMTRAVLLALDIE